MRHAIVLSTVLTTLPLVAQDAPLPAVTPRPQTPVLIALAVEPMREPETFTLEDAARNNDYPTFRALYEQTRSAAWAPLHELWTYSVNDPIGAFYGPEMYERFARLYPDFAAYIDDHKIVDDRGNVFYPTSETRAFLMNKAIEGRVVAPRQEIRVARAERRSGFSPTPPQTTAPRVRFKKAEAAPKPVERKPVPLPAPVTAPAIVQAAVVAPVAPRPVVTASIIPATPRKTDDGAPVGRGILLILLGITGIGILTLILRTPREQMPSVTTAPPPPSGASDLGKAPQ
jgi:hypothetical protein